jgi:hypothetical protein
MGTVKVTNIEPIADNGTVTLGGSGDTVSLGTTAGGELRNGPAFIYHGDTSTTQSISNSTWTEITIFNTIGFDTDTKFSSTTGRFTPTVAGKYYVTGSVYFTAGTPAGGFNSIAITKNGSLTLNSINEVAYIRRGAIDTLSVNGIIEMDNDDYISVFINQQSGGSVTVGGGSAASLNFFGAQRMVGV